MEKTKTKTKEEVAFILLRTIVAIIIASHGWHRLLSGGYEPFGGWLSSQGFPFGLGIAWAITLFEIIGSLFLITGKQLPYICASYIVIYIGGIFLVHLQHGWFVVGSGTNGIEYSTLLVVSLLCIGYPHMNKKDNLKAL
ncbi:DoxX family protein [Shewanella sp. KX20019]|uniref:DoxX family protein n=1 Tax=Shewanella sp. KX20019 TaxID=2803864 RepID=UPI001927E97D|nr:DoxX family protein [Shewanella sp. KX20019]QQX81722.1 DoxX family protein [Shewanella sp. KX20019]